MAEKYDCFSPYHFSGNNPILFVDGNGMDWYSYTDDDGNKHYKYQDGSDKSIKVGDNTYSNIGASVNIQIGEGYYYNAFQNYGVSSIDGPIDVKQKILGSSSLQGKLLSEGSGFSQQGQAQIVTALIHKGQADFYNHPVTQATLSGLLFVATGGIEGAASILSAGRSLLARGAAAEGGRVFWSGGEKAMNAAASYAKANGMTTLEMTRAGQNLTNLTKGLPWSEAGPMWQRMSATYAKGANGTVHVFQNAQGVGMNSVWRTVEYPILRQNAAKIIYHRVP